MIFHIIGTWRGCARTLYTGFSEKSGVLHRKRKEKCKQCPYTLSAYNFALEQ